MFYDIEVESSTESTIYMPSELYKHKEYINKSFLIKAGYRKQLVEVIPKSQLRPNLLIISKDVVDNLSIPYDIKYQVEIKDFNIVLGPVIGLLLMKFDWEFDIDNSNYYLPYTDKYPEYHGLIYIFGADGINHERDLIEGYYYKPGSIPVFKRGIFPYPDVMYRKVPIQNDIRRYLKEKTRNLIFNSYFYDKKELYDILSLDAILKNYIPDTCLYNSLCNVDEMILKHKAVILKPAYSSRDSIMVIEKLDESYVFELIPGQRPVYVHNKKEAENFINTVKGKGEYIIQKYLNMLKYNKNSLEFRIIMQKDNLKWRNPFIIACTGNEKSKVKGFRYFNLAQTFDSLNPGYMHTSMNKLIEKKKEMFNICKRICSILDNSGENIMEFELHIILDDNFNIYIFDMGKIKDSLTPSTAEIKRFYDKTKVNEVEYCLNLSGFNINPSHK
jgi:hypothetical protein